MRLSILLGFLVGAALYFSFRVQVPPTTPIVCNDGWHSLSIGKHGACSHHRGVNYDNSPRQVANKHNTWLLFGSIFSGFLVFIWIEERVQLTGKPPPFWGGDTKEVIELAIKHGRFIRFKYTKKDALVAEARLIKPDKLVELPRRGSNLLCVQGHCYLRNDTRTFALKRMSHVKLMNAAEASKQGHSV